MRIATRRAAFEPHSWTTAEATRVASFFDALAIEWTSRFTAEEMAPLRDALERGGPFTGPCLDVGSGTGLGTAILSERFGSVVALDLSIEMLRNFVSADGVRVAGDAARLPVRSGSIGTLVLVNAFLFPAEVDRVLAPGGAVVWVNSLAEDTPIHLPATDVVGALPGSWDAVCSEAGWGSWAVVRRSADAAPVADLRHRRTTYMTDGLEVADVDPNPMAQWRRWYDDAVAASLTEPNAAVVSTVGANGQPDARYVLVRGADDAGFEFFTNYESAKAHQLAENDRASMTFGWLDHHRQVRIRGRVEVLSPVSSDAYWASRPRDSQLASAASPQSRLVSGRRELEARVEELRDRFSSKESVPRPEHWGGYRLVPEEIEFWQGRPARLHDRLWYRRATGEDGPSRGWTIERLAP